MSTDHNLDLVILEPMQCKLGPFHLAKTIALFHSSNNGLDSDMTGNEYVMMTHH